MRDDRSRPSVDAPPSITRNTIWNLVGIAAPIPVALVAIPGLIARLGQERFGLLTIAWALMGYFGVLDLGLSRATTTYVARALHRREHETVRDLFWTSASAHFALGTAGGLILFLAAPWLERMLSVDLVLRGETRLTLQLLAISVPVLLLTSVARGLLEAFHRFDLVNAVKIPASVITYLGPLVTVAFTHRLPPIVAVILACRIAVLVTYLIMCVRVAPAIQTWTRPRMATLKPLIAMGGWITVGTVLTPALVSIDRFVIGAAVSVAAVTAYAAPYEVVTKLWIFSGSLMGVLFPRFSVLAGDREALQRLCRQGLVLLTLCTTPIAGLMLAFAPEFIQLWLGPEIARQGVSVARWLTIGVLINVIAQVPYTVLQATDHADATGKLQLLEFPFYALSAWFAALHWGVVGVAIVWGMRAALEAVLMFAAAWHRLGPIYARGAPATAGLVIAGSAVFLAWCWGAVPLLTSDFVPKVLLVVLSIAAFTYLAARSLHVNLNEAGLLLRG